jgi:glyoxylase-like metal-dependent hydrolase (beta-lactamase superfamily II)
VGITNTQSGTNVHEVADGIFRINTPVSIAGGPGGFSFNQYLITDDEPLLFHTGPRKMFPLVHEAVSSVLPVRRLRYIAFSHVEADECGSLNEWLAVSTGSIPLCGKVAALVSVNDLADWPPRALADGETLSLGTHSVRWFDTPHLPHAWECGYLMEERTGTLSCGDLFTQGEGGSSCDNGIGYTGAKRSVPPEDGLLFPHNKWEGDAGETCFGRAKNARLYARQRMTWGWRGDAESIGRSVVSVAVATGNIGDSSDRQHP